MILDTNLLVRSAQGPARLPTRVAESEQITMLYCSAILAHEAIWLAALERVHLKLHRRTRGARPEARPRASPGPTSPGSLARYPLEPRR